jgi:hypothetical protein
MSCHANSTNWVSMEKSFKIFLYSYKQKLFFFEFGIIAYFQINYFKIREKLLKNILK